jgi:hypothetical protein
MKRHTVTSKELQDYVNGYWLTFASSSRSGSNKKLEVHMSGLYRVTNDIAIIYIGDDAIEAVNQYNNQE